MYKSGRICIFSRLSAWAKLRGYPSRSHPFCFASSRAKRAATIYNTERKKEKIHFSIWKWSKNELQKAQILIIHLSRFHQEPSDQHSWTLLLSFQFLSQLLLLLLADPQLICAPIQTAEWTHNDQIYSIYFNEWTSGIAMVPLWVLCPSELLNMTGYTTHLTNSQYILTTYLGTSTHEKKDGYHCDPHEHHTTDLYQPRNMQTVTNR